MAYLENMEIVGRTESGKPIVRFTNSAGNLRYAVGYFDKGVAAVRDNALTYRRLCEVKGGRIAKGSRSDRAGISINVEDDEDE